MKRLMFLLMLLGSFAFLPDARAQDNLLLNPEFWETATSQNVNEAMDSGADIHERDAKGWSALHHAIAYNGAPAVVALLLRKGANIEARTEQGVSPLHFAVENSEAADMVALLLEHSANIEARDEDGWTALHWATVFNRTPAVAKFLLDRGADASVIDADGRTPFDYARENEFLRGSREYWRLNDARFE